MANEYEQAKIVKTYFTIIIFDSCGDEYDDMEKWQCSNFSSDRKNRVQWDNIKDPCLKVIDMMKSDKELGEEYGVWSYLVCKHEEDTENNDWQSFYKVYKYRGKWKYKEVDY